MPPIDMPIASLMSMRLLFMKLKPVVGIRNAQALIMIGKARRGSRPSRLSRISEGA